MSRSPIYLGAALVCIRKKYVCSALECKFDTRVFTLLKNMRIIYVMSAVAPSLPASRLGASHRCNLGLEIDGCGADPVTSQTITLVGSPRLPP